MRNGRTVSPTGTRQTRAAWAESTGCLTSTMDPSRMWATAYLPAASAVSAPWPLRFTGDEERRPVPLLEEVEHRGDALAGIGRTGDLHHRFTWDAAERSPVGLPALPLRDEERLVEAGGARGHPLQLRNPLGEFGERHHTLQDRPLASPPSSETVLSAPRCRWGRRRRLATPGGIRTMQAWFVVRGDRMRRWLPLAMPDLRPFSAGSHGVPWAWTLESGRPGLHVGIVALVHGGEAAGAHALVRLLDLRIRPVRGSLTLLFANPEAASRHDPRAPHRARFLDRDLNRLWDPGAPAGEGAEAGRRRELLALVASMDVVLDIHTAGLDTPPLLFCGPGAQGIELGRHMVSAELLVHDPPRADGMRLVDFVRARGGIGLLLEAGRHDDPKSADVALACALELLTALAMLDADTAALLPGPRRAPAILEVSHEVCVEEGPFVPAAGIRHLVPVARAGTLVARDGTRPVRAPYDGCIPILPARDPPRGTVALRLARQLAGPPLAARA